MELVTDRHGEREVNLVTALAFYSIFCCLKSLLNLEQRNEVVVAIGVEMFSGVSQTERSTLEDARKPSK